VAIDKDDAKRVAHLAKIGLQDEEAERLAADLDKILDYFLILSEADVDDVSPWASPTEKAAERPDVARRSDTGKATLEGAPDREGGYFRVPRVIG